MDEINNKLQEYSGDDWKTNLKYDPSRYTRNSVFKDDNCQIMIMCWPPDYVSPIHDHNNSECYNKLLDGSIIEKKFKIKNNDFTLLEESKIEKNDIIRINDEIGLHQIFNFDSKNKLLPYIYMFLLMILLLFIKENQVILKNKS